MKILRVSNSLSPEKVGGIGVHVDEMSKIQGENGHEVTVLTSDNGDRSLPHREDRGEYSVIRHKELARPADNSIAPGMIRSIVRQLRDYDVIHAHSYLYFSTNITSIISRLSDVPLAITHHGLFPSSAPNIIKKAYIPTVGRLTFNSADNVFCYTQSAANLLDEHNVTVPKKVIHNGIDCNRFSPDPSATSSAGQQLLFVGRVKRGKGAELLMEAFESVKQDYPELSVKIVGDGPQLSTLQEKYDDNRIIYAGEISYEEMPKQFRESDLLVLPTVTEAAIPRVVMEAWACGIPAVMTDVPRADRSKINAGGISLSRRTSEEVETAIRRLLEDDQLRREKGKRGRNIVLNNFSWEETVNMTTDQLRQISNLQ
ncbi:glycosyltransferase family 4 protein [Natronosalvus vescus]|uniref:glycosyltransferase family 4 protein n=1 Tax=Natronosalvus vescus TaxID=2953881 RepID=UPI00209145D3|nr:glycosyltransferase family 4 protein [Natronosalvus vescus]